MRPGKNRAPVPATPTGPEKHAIEALSNARDDFEEAFGQDHYYTRLVTEVLAKIEDEEKRGRPTPRSDAFWKNVKASLVWPPDPAALGRRYLQLHNMPNSAPMGVAFAMGYRDGRAEPVADPAAAATAGGPAAMAVGQDGDRGVVVDTGVWVDYAVPTVEYSLREAPVLWQSLYRFADFAEETNMPSITTATRPAKVTTQWECECGALNPERTGRCLGCRLSTPKRVEVPVDPDLYTGLDTPEPAAAPTSASPAASTPSFDLDTDRRSK